MNDELNGSASKPTPQKQRPGMVPVEQLKSTSVALLAYLIVILLLIALLIFSVKLVIGQL